MARHAKTRTAANPPADLDDLVSEALAGIMQRVRESSETVTEDVAERTTKAGTDALKWIAEEVEQRPFVLLAIAAGAGFLFGMARR